ncbi:MAG: efflux RND transporter periplasmic adaptor subunit [Syntrophales bacterium]
MERSLGCRLPGALLCAFSIMMSVLLFVSCSQGKEDRPPPKPPAPVTVAYASERNVPVQLTAIGNVEAIETIQIKSQLVGVLHKVHFREGRDVAKGALLFTIDPRPYEAQVKQAEANLARDKAQLAYAVEQAGRYGELFKKGYVAKEQEEQYRTNAATLEAVGNADKAALDNARLQLQYCYIYAPLAGRTGNLNVNEGNLIKANADTAMIVINQLRPIYVTFSLPEQNLEEVKKYLDQGKIAVEASISKDDRLPERGVLTFVDNNVDSATGTIKLKGTFTNMNHKLWPGQFVSVLLTLTTRPHALLVPTSAIQTGQSGQFVFVVKSDNTVEFRPVFAGPTINEETVIDKGLNPGETVVTDGQMRLIPGAKVEIRKSAPEAGKKGPPQAVGDIDTVKGKRP